MKKNLLGKLGTLQPYGQFTLSDYERVETPISTYAIGINWLQAGHRSKLSLDYQSRPILVEGTGEKLVIDSANPRKGMWVIQYQFSF
ncbi:MAG: hypothetical protein EP311_00645 [Cytophagales bacterium]|nr:MAG: hypothetical protein EP311_00645 [Cytophagales bacterium]